jgi:hypothetical protein
MLNRVGDQQLAGVPQFADLRKQILEEALFLYRGFLRQESDDPAVRQETARAYFQVGQLYLLLTQLAPAEEHARAAVALQERLVADFPDRPDYRRDLSKSLASLGHVHSMRSRLKLAGEAFDQARVIDERLHREHPENPDYLVALAEASRDLGWFHMGGSEFGRAEADFRQWIALAERLVQAHPDSADYRCLLAEGSTALGTLLFVLGGFIEADKRELRLAEAEKALDRARLLLQPADRAAPRSGKTYADVLAANQVYRGAIYLRTNRLALARDNLREGVAGFEQLARGAPRHLVRRLQLAMSYPLLADLYIQIGESALAEEALQKGLERIDDLSRDLPAMYWLSMSADSMRVVRAIMVLRRGGALTDRAQVDRMAGRKDLPGAVYYNLACVYALLSATVPAGGKEAEGHAGRAMALLERSAQAGYLVTARTIEHARKDPDLKALRPRPDFRKLLAEKAKVAGG